MGNMLFVFAITFLLCQGISGDRNSMRNKRRCYKAALCVQPPDFSKYVESHRNNETQRDVITIQEDLVKDVCSFLLNLANCVDNNPLISLRCDQNTQRVFKAFQNVVRSGCSSIVDDLTNLIKCVNDPDIQRSYSNCVDSLNDQIISLDDDDNCGRLDLIMTCNSVVAACDPVAVGNIENFIQSNKDDICLLKNQLS